MINHSFGVDVPSSIENTPAKKMNASGDNYVQRLIDVSQKINYS